VVFRTMDTDMSGRIGCREFIEACTNDGEITMHRMAQYFHKDDLAVHSLRKFFDDTEKVATRTASAFFQNASGTLEDGDKDARDGTPTRPATSGRPMTPDLQQLADLMQQAPEKMARVIQDDVDQMVTRIAHRDQEASNLERKQQPKPSPSSEVALHRLESIVANLERRLRAQEDNCEQTLGLLRSAFDARMASWNNPCPVMTPQTDLRADVAVELRSATAKSMELRASSMKAMGISSGDCGDQGTLPRQPSAQSVAQSPSCSIAPSEASREDTLTQLGFLARTARGSMF